ncbi:MAG: hypothetical protein Q9159_006039 [Coniocarpon cinnabarinum]
MAIIGVTGVTTLILASLASGQTSTKCNPLTSACPKDGALGTTFSQTWNSSSPSALDEDFWTVTGGAQLMNMKDSGLVMTLNNKGDSVTAQTSFYIFWGEVEIQYQAASGQGIISTLTFLSDDLDEIDVEAQGSNSTHVSTNWYGQGDQSQNNAIWYPVTPSPQSQLHTYRVSWTQEQIQWWFDNQLVRTYAYSAPKHYPQTPSFIKMGLWSAGDSDQPGTVAWAGGPTQWDQAPFAMTVKSIKIKDGSTNASSYTYDTPSDGSWQKIKIENGTSSAAEDANKPPPQSMTQRWHGLTTGAKVGIAAGAVGAAALGGLAFVFFFFKQRRAGKKERLAADAAWDREHTELMSYQVGAGKDEYGASQVSVTTTQQHPPTWR